MPDSEKIEILLDELAALDPAQRRVVAKELRKVSQTFAEVRDGKAASYVLGVLAHLLDRPSGSCGLQREWSARSDYGMS